MYVFGVPNFYISPDGYGPLQRVPWASHANIQRNCRHRPGCLFYLRNLAHSTRSLIKKKFLKKGDDEILNERPVEAHWNFPSDVLLL